MESDRELSTGLDIARLQAAGLYDPAAADAADRLDLLTFLAEHGATVEDMVAAEATRNLSSLALDLHMRRGSLTARDLAERAEVDLDVVLEAYRILGIAIDDPDARRFDDDEVSMLRLAHGAFEIMPGDTIVEILRAVGTALSIIAESEVTAFVGSVEDVLEAGVPRERAETTLVAGQMAIGLGHHLPPLLRHHLVAATDRQRTAMAGATDRRSSTFTVGFVDLVGFTSATATMTTDELLAFVQDFHRRTFDVVTSIGSGGRVVKHIGDEIMFSAPDPTTGCRIAHALTDAFRDDHTPPRGGMAHGIVVARHGDLYGPVVNLAARLADVAVPGEVLVDDAVRSGADGSIHFEPAGRRQLKGFATPVSVATLLA